MTVTATWENEQHTCVIISFDRPWTWGEFDEAYAEMDKLFKSVPNKVDLILDITNGGLPPGNAMQHFKQVSENQHANLGKIIVVGLPGYFRGILNILRSVYRGRYEAPGYYFVASREKAREMLDDSSRVTQVNPTVSLK